MSYSGLSVIKGIIKFLLLSSILMTGLIFIPYSLASDALMVYINSTMDEARLTMSQAELDMLFQELLDRYQDYKFQKIFYYSIITNVILIPFIFLYSYFLKNKNFLDEFIFFCFPMLGFLFSSGNLLPLLLPVVYIFANKLSIKHSKSSNSSTN
jgi:hypothetical protein